MFLGSHSCIIPQIHVGEWAYIGAGSIVFQDIKPGVKVFGNPAVTIGKVEGVENSLLRIIEMNSHSDVNLLQVHGPLLRDERVKWFYTCRI